MHIANFFLQYAYCVSQYAYCDRIYIASNICVSPSVILSVRVKRGMQSKRVFTKKFHRLAFWGNTLYAWAGGTFFPVVSFLVLAGNRFWFYIRYYLCNQSTIQLLVFLVVAGNSFWCYVRTQCTIRVLGPPPPGRHLRLSGGKKKNACDFSDETSHA